MTRPILIIGQGIAGTVLGLSLEQRDIPFVVLDNNHRTSSSLAAAGLYNPLIIKRHKLAWNAAEFISTAVPFYRQMQELLDAIFLHETGILRRISTVKEVNDWESKKDLVTFNDFLDKDEGDELDLGAIPAELGLLTIKQAGWVDVDLLLQSSRAHWLKNGQVIEQEFNDDAVAVHEGYIEYQGEQYSKIVLCRGYREMHESRFFPGLPFKPAKGQTLVIEAEELRLKKPLHAGLFFIPIGANRYRVGSSYSWSNFDESPEQSQSQMLKEKIDAICPVPYTIVREWAGVRPAVKDRRPLLGHSQFSERVCLFNGLGSRGIMLAPQLAQQMIDYMCKELSLPSDISLSRWNDQA